MLMFFKKSTTVISIQYCYINSIYLYSKIRQPSQRNSTYWYQMLSNRWNILNDKITYLQK
jgi:hypothetical protein